MGAVGNDWQFVGVNDLNGDGTDDMMLRNTTTGMFELYTIRNDGVAAASSIGAVVRLRQCEPAGGSQVIDFA
jgi:hypothetical protein